MNSVVAVIITYNVGQELINNIHALKSNVNEVIIVDNGSNSNTLNILETIKNEVSLIKLDKNMGIAYALNKGINEAINKGYKWILTLDHDSRVTDNMVNDMIQEYERIDEKQKEKIVMLTPVHFEAKNVDEGTINDSDNKSWSYVLTEITSGSLVKADYYKRNLYNEKLFIDLVDHDFCLNINKQGFKIIQVNKAILIHNLGESVEKSFLGLKVVCTNHSAIRRYYMSRNRAYVWKIYKKDFPQWVLKDKQRFISEMGKVVFFESNKISKIKMTIIGFIDYYKRRWGSIDQYH